MASRSATSHPYPSAAEVWYEIFQTAVRDTPRTPLIYAARWIKSRWKPVVLSVAFWVIYGYAFALWLTR